MSQENVESVRDAMEAFNERDIDRLLQFADPEVEWHPPAELPGTSVYHGHDGVRQAIADMLDAFGDLRAEPQRSSMPTTEWSLSTDGAAAGARVGSQSTTSRFRSG